MADISMCYGEIETKSHPGVPQPCPQRETCYRYKASASTYQSYFVGPMEVHEYEDNNIVCTHYWRLNG